MRTNSRRRFLQKFGTAGFAASLTTLPEAAWCEGATSSSLEHHASQDALQGFWKFILDPDKKGEARSWHQNDFSAESWTSVQIPHTWQVNPATASYLGTAWYRRDFDVPAAWAEMAVRLEFEAVFHSATVWLNGKLVGQHLRKGYTAFVVDLSPALLPGKKNTLAVKVENPFDLKMLPRDNSYDWTVDGGIYRPVHLLVTPKVYIERIDVEAVPEIPANAADLDVRVLVRNSGSNAATVQLSYRVVENDTAREVAGQPASSLTLAAGESREVALPAKLLQPRLWHFDHPHLYRLEAAVEDRNNLVHRLGTHFGIRKIEVRNGAFYLNDERVWLMGVERMAGSHPDYGMAEPESWILHDHDDMKELNCVFTRVHWQQDRRVLDYCDRNGILIQVEVPTWGPDTFKGMGTQPDAIIMENGLEQLREMIQRDRNHPSIFAWGLCNEINGQNPPAFQFAKRMYEEAKRLDPRRLRTYASNSLQSTPGKDVSALMDFVSWNEYYESWYGGNTESVRKNLGAIHEAFPDKMVVISEYGYCECAPQRPPGDRHRIDVLRNHTSVYREFDFVGGAIFFCYNDYRTHIGDKGIGALKQRVHGVVDLYGVRKPSFEALRKESSPVELLEVKLEGETLKIQMAVRKKLPSYRLEGYRLRWIVFGYEGLPMEQNETSLPPLSPGEQTSLDLRLKEKNPHSVRVDVMRPTRFSAATAVWRRP